MGVGLRIFATHKAAVLVNSSGLAAFNSALNLAAILAERYPDDAEVARMAHDMQAASESIGVMDCTVE